MTFAAPFWLIATVILTVLLIIGYRQLERWKSKALESFAATGLLSRLTESIPKRNRLLKAILFLLGIISILLALARPQVGYRWEEVHRKGIDILIALDVSKSMLSDDIRPNRLERAKLAIRDFVTHLQGDRIGLLPFAGSSFLLCPLTIDYNAFLDTLDVTDVNVIPRGGTDIGGTIEEALTIFAAKPNNHHFLILMTDGEDLEGSALTAARNAANAGVQIFTVGIGTESGSLIPITRDDGSTGFQQDPSGQLVRSRLDDKTLRQIAETTGGAYYPLDRDSNALEMIYTKHLSQLPRQDIAQKMKKIPFEQFQFPLALALILLMVEYMLREYNHRHKRKTKIPAAPSFLAKQSGTALTILLFLCLAGNLVAATTPEQAIQDFQKGLFSTAEQGFRESAETTPTRYDLHYNEGVAAYKNGDFNQATDAFKQTLHSSDLDLQEKSYYNMGNSYFRQGQSMAPTKPEQTVELWKKSLEAYQSALSLNPKDADSKYNHTYVKKLLDELEKQQKKRQQQQNQQQNQDQNQQQNQNQNQQKSGDQQQNQQQNSGNGDQQQKPNDQNGADKKNPQQNQNSQSPGNTPDKKKNEGQKDESGKGQPKPDDKKNNKNSDSDIPQSQGKDAPDPAEEARQQLADLARKRAGRMTRAEANRLLEAERNEEHRLNPTPINGSTPRTDEPVKDW